jgi:hypothetical protein
MRRATRNPALAPLARDPAADRMTESSGVSAAFGASVRFTELSSDVPSPNHHDDSRRLGVSDRV